MNKPQVGDTIEFMGKNALDFHVEQSKKFLEVGKRYTVSDIFMDKWGIYVYLNEAPNKTFRAEMFAFIKSSGGSHAAKKNVADETNSVPQLAD